MVLPVPEGPAEDELTSEGLGLASFLIPNWVEYWYWPVPSTTIMRP